MAAVPLPTKYKLVFLGDKSVGKTSILTRFLYDKFDTTYTPTIGIDFLSSRTTYVEDKAIRLQFWDTTGDERFRRLVPAYIKDSSVIVYDVTNRQSFLNTTKWIKEVHKEIGTDAIIVLVGNKTDLVDKRQVAIEEGDGKAREFGFVFIETSAKTGFNTKALFQNIAAVLSGIEPPSSEKQEDKVDVNLKSSGSTPAVTSQQSVQGSLDNKNVMTLDTVSSSTEIEHYKNNAKELTADDFVEIPVKTNDNNSLMMSNNENKIKDDMDKRAKSMLERMMEGMLKKMDEMQEGNRRMEEKIKEVKGRCQCRRVHDQRCDDILKKMEDMMKRMNEMQAGNRRVEERIKEVEGLSERGKLDDIKRWENMSRRLAEMADCIGILTRLESRKNLQHKEVDDDFDDAVFV